MSYQVIARKWRPKHFDQLVGQDHVSQTLLNALNNDRLHHALLFTGPRGTGKTSSARILAKALRCPDDPQGESQEAKDIAAGRSVDVIEIDGASNNGVDAIRDLRETVAYMPSSGKYKVYIIDEVHMLSTAAFNALLKTLEEPPEHVVFVMATTEAQKIPNTILSRCQRFDFRRIPIQLISQRLEEICKADGVEADDEALWAIARQGDGSMRDSQSLLDQVITFSGNHITMDKVSGVLGLTDRALLVASLQAIANQDRQSLLNIIEKLFTSGLDPQIFTQDLLEQFRNALVIKVSTDSSALLDISSAEADQLRSLVEPLTEEDLHFLFDITLKGLNDLIRSTEPRIVLEMLLMRLAAAPRIQSLTGLTLHTPAPGVEKKNTQHPSNPRPVTTSLSQPPPTTQNLKPISSSTVKPEQVPVTGSLKPKETPVMVAGGYNNDISAQENWHSLVGQIKRHNGLVGAQLENTFLGKVENNTLYVGVPQNLKFMYEKINNPSFREKTLNFVNKIWGPGYKIDVHMEADAEKHLTPKQALEIQRRDKRTNDKKAVEAHPFYQSVSKLFDTEIKFIKEIKS